MGKNMGIPFFGDKITSNFASEDNPRKYGIFIRAIHRKHGQVNPGLHYYVTDGRGDFWEVAAESATIKRCGGIREAIKKTLAEAGAS